MSPSLWKSYFQPARNSAICLQEISKGSTSFKFIIVAESLFADLGSGWHSRKSPSIPAALGSLTGGLLRAVGRVENHRASQLLHDCQTREIVDQAVVAEEGAALG